MEDDSLVDIGKILDNWQTHRFVVVNSSSLNIDPEVYPQTVVLADVGYWTERIQELREWCDQHGCRFKGMTVSVPTEDLITLFCLKWK